MSSSQHVTARCVHLQHFHVPLKNLVCYRKKERKRKDRIAIQQNFSIQYFIAFLRHQHKKQNDDNHRPDVGGRRSAVVVATFVDRELLSSSTFTLLLLAVTENSPVGRRMVWARCACHVDL